MDKPLQLDDAARNILRQNSRGSYTVPTAKLYPFQWNWDSAFIACGLASFDIDRAWTELETLLAAQWDNGMVPHIVFHSPHADYFPGPDTWGTNGDNASSGITQPPVAATIARGLYERDRAVGRKRMAALFPRLLAWHRWFHAYRCESGAIAATHPWETGRDNAPDWDLALAGVDTSRIQPFKRSDLEYVEKDMRPTGQDYDRYMALVQFGREVGWNEEKIRSDGPFRVADPTLTFTLLRANRDLRAIASEFSEPVAEIDHWIDCLVAGSRTLWNPVLGAFDSVDLRSGNPSGSLSNASFLCWYAGLDEPAMLERLEEVLEKARFGVPSYAPDADGFDSRRYWRGPVWAMMNMLIGIGLNEYGHVELARRVRNDVRLLILSGGFAEYFDPCDGEPAGGKNFSWTAAVWLAWATPTLKEGNDGIVTA